jgi:hypothetical protein
LYIDYQDTDIDYLPQSTFTPNVDPLIVQRVSEKAIFKPHVHDLVAQVEPRSTFVRRVLALVLASLSLVILALSGGSRALEWMSVVTCRSYFQP